ncbi:MAG: CHAD domain-containing protein [Mycobacterium sp.]|uniref:CHAD domain-containing protein n=1 Tax=Mycobacterium sp. TaxID=1785 RepID=UPI001EC5FF13|nr:CHAD domain-containing protein [Mycobacterium sp.]MBV8787585.1 CHAD domain-containing protein [Mycobacterium sp.]
MHSAAPTLIPTVRGTRALVDYLNAQIDGIEAGDIALRHGEDDDTIHDTRVAIRRLRSTLRIFAKVLDTAEIGDMDAELKWFAGLLGDVRDCQVQRSHFADVLDGMPDELVLGPVRSRIEEYLNAIEFPAREGIAEAMGSARYQSILTILRRWRAQPPAAGAVTSGTLRQRARRAQRKADRRLAEALESADDAMLHRARKAAKRARYAAELCESLGQGARAKRTIKQYKQIQSLLGDHQDAVVGAETLRRIGVTAGTTVGENGFTFGLLYAHEQQLARQSRQEARQL